VWLLCKIVRQRSLWTLFAFWLGELVHARCSVDCCVDGAVASVEERIFALMRGANEAVPRWADGQR
jgi:hypothetical protein